MKKSKKIILFIVILLIVASILWRVPYTSDHPGGHNIVYYRNNDKIYVYPGYAVPMDHIGEYSSITYKDAMDQGMVVPEGIDVSVIGPPLGMYYWLKLRGCDIGLRWQATNEYISHE